MFTGELMKCGLCNFEQRSHSQIESGWFKVVMDGKPSHLCPKCGGAPAPKCGKCRRFYHERYSECPWCKAAARAKGFGGGETTAQQPLRVGVSLEEYHQISELSMPCSVEALKSILKDERAEQIFSASFHDQEVEVFVIGSDRTP